MSITIIKAIEAMEQGCICFCIATQTYWRKKERLQRSSTKDFKISSCRRNSCEIFYEDEILSEWEIVEEPKLEIKPCIYCGCECRISNPINSYAGRRKYFYTFCVSFYCSYASGDFESEKEAVYAHNSIYDMLNGCAYKDEIKSPGA